MLNIMKISDPKSTFEKALVVYEHVRDCDDDQQKIRNISLSFRNLRKTIVKLAQTPDLSRIWNKIGNYEYDITIIMNMMRYLFLAKFFYGAFALSSLCFLVFI